MSKHGPQRTPTKILERRGSWLAKVREPDEAKVEPSIPQPPKELSAAALAEWHSIVPKLFSAGLLTKLDGAALAAYCQNYADWLEAVEKVREAGAVVKAPSGYPILNPYVGIASRAQAAMVRMLMQFGMSPASRSSAKAEKKDENDGGAIDKWLEQNAG